MKKKDSKEIKKEIVKTRKELVNMLINQNLETEDEDQLMKLLIDKHIAVDVDKEDKINSRKSDKVADLVTKTIGSWEFIISFIFFLSSWIYLNVTALKHLDPYPFILLNLILSCVAAIQAPIIMMSQNREAKKDTLRNRNDYKTNLKSELILEELYHHTIQIITNQKKILSIINQDSEETTEIVDMPNIKMEENNNQKN